MARRKKAEEALEITFAKPGDEADIAMLIAALAEYEKAPQENKSTPEKVRAQLFEGKAGAEVLMARIGSVTVGFALFFPNFSTWLCKPGMYLEDLFVLPEYRKGGVGRALLQRLAQICVERDYGRFEWSCLEWNELAKGVYRKLGAVPLEEWRTWRMTEDKIQELAEGRPTPAEALELELETEEVVQVEPETQEELDEVIVYTDGGCRPNPGIGAWAAVLQCKGKLKEFVGGETETTNNRMEMLAAINALESLRRRCRVVMTTDSEYLKNGITKWIHGWKKKNWRKKDGEPVLNADLWKRLDVLMKKHDVKWDWVRGHAGDVMNERCDELCTQEIDRLTALKRAQN
jgi:ribonuclease HI